MGYWQALLFLGFLFIAGLYNSDIGLLFFGILCIAGAIWINKAYEKIIINTVSVSFFIIGFILLGLGLEKLKMSESTISIVFILVSLCSLNIGQNYILSFVAVLLINGSILTLIISNKGYDLIHMYVFILALFLTYFFLKEAKIIMVNKTLSKLYPPMRIGFIFSFLSGLTILGKKGILPVSPEYIWLSSVVILTMITFLLSYLFEVFNVTQKIHKISFYVFSIILLLPTTLSPAISGAILIILLSFLVNYKTGLVLGIIAFVYFVSQYYYDLNFTLLIKSILLFSSGVLFLTLYIFTHKKLTTNEKV